jgi:hypothetical protein
MAGLPANTVAVVKAFHAACKLCPDWRGPDRATFADAGQDRQRHLGWHNADNRDG